MRTLLMAFSALAVAADWPQFLGPQRNATSTEAGLLTRWPAKGPPVVWEREVGDGYSAPVIAGDKLIIFHSAGGSDVVDCLDAGTGKVRWSAKQPSGYTDDYGKGDGPRTTPLIAAGRVFILGALGRLSCWDLATGKPMWQRNLMEDYKVRKPFFGLGAGLLAEGNTLLLNLGARDAGIIALDAATGKEVWKTTDHEASYAAPVAATIDGVRHAIFFTREGLVSVDPANGKVRFSKHWRSRQHASVNAATPIIAGGLVFVSASYGTGALLARVHKESVDEVWKGDNALSCHYNTPVLVAGNLYGIDGRQESRAQLVCVDLKTGNIRWTRERFGCASILAVDGHLLMLTEDGDLVLARATPESYQEKARASVMNGPVRCELALANGRLYARDGKKLICWKIVK